MALRLGGPWTFSKSLLPYTSCDPPWGWRRPSLLEPKPQHRPSSSVSKEKGEARVTLSPLCHPHPPPSNFRSVLPSLSLQLCPDAVLRAKPVPPVSEADLLLSALRHRQGLPSTLLGPQGQGQFLPFPGSLGGIARSG